MVRPVAILAKRRHRPLIWSDVLATIPWCVNRSPLRSIRVSSTYSSTTPAGIWRTIPAHDCWTTNWWWPWIDRFRSESIWISRSRLCIALCRCDSVSKRSHCLVWSGDGKKITRRAVYDCTICREMITESGALSHAISLVVCFGL